MTKTYNRTLDDVLEIFDNTIEFWKPVRDQRDDLEAAVRAQHYIEAWTAIRQTVNDLPTMQALEDGVDAG